MAGKTAVELEAIIQADRAERERKKQQQLAQDLLGSKNRRASGSPLVRNNRNHVQAAVPSLASRIGSPGISKRGGLNANPTRVKPPRGNPNAEWTHDLHSLNNPAALVPGLTNRAAKTLRDGRNIAHALNHGYRSSPNLGGQFNVVGNSRSGQGMSIRGMAGMCAVRAQNFAPGTTAADIESALAPVGGTILSCRLIASTPTVIAEIIFEGREGAENVVQTFNNQPADGRLLYVYIKPGPVSLPPGAQAHRSSAAAPVATSSPGPPTGPRADRAGRLEREPRNDSRYDARPRYESRSRSRERRRSYDHTARNDVIDGSYGFDDPDRMEVEEVDDRRDDRRDHRDGGRGSGGLYSDSQPRRGDRGRGYGDNKDRGRNGDRSRGYR